jgi:hypothetical protein
MSMARNETLILALSNLESSMGVDRLTFPKRSKAVERRDKRCATLYNIILRICCCNEISGARLDRKTIERSEPALSV